jgi:hypothetical protein
LKTQDPDIRPKCSWRLFALSGTETASPCLCPWDQFCRQRWPSFIISPYGTGRRDRPSALNQIRMNSRLVSCSAVDSQLNPTPPSISLNGVLPDSLHLPLCAACLSAKSMASGQDNCCHPPIPTVSHPRPTTPLYSYHDTRHRPTIGNTKLK